MALGVYDPSSKSPVGDETDLQLGAYVVRCQEAQGALDIVGEWLRAVENETFVEPSFPLVSAGENVVPRWLGEPGDVSRATG